MSDERKIEPRTVNTETRNSGSILLSKPVAEYVEGYFNNSIKPNSLDTNQAAVKIIIDQFKIEENKFFKYSFRFSTPVSGDTDIIFRIASKFPLNDSASYTFNELIDYGLSRCLDSFFVYGSGKGANNYVIIDKGEKKSAATEDFRHKSSVDEKDSAIEKNESVVEVKVDKFPEKIRLSSVGFSFLSGGKITTGVQLYYSTGTCKKESSLLMGYGMGIVFYDINNKTNFIKGIHISGAFPLFMQYFFSSGLDGPYAGASLRFTLGQETIDYGYEKSNTLFFGPTFEPNIGIKISDGFSLDAGFYLLKFFGSKLLPEDYGYRINSNIWF